MTSASRVQRLVWPVAVLIVVAAQNMTDRIEALGGQLEITSAVGAGTVVTGRVPVRAAVGVGPAPEQGNQ